jgi:hypothetical protein
MTEVYYLRSKNCEVLSQIKGHSVNICDFLSSEAVTDGKNPSYAAGDDDDNMPDYVFFASIVGIKNRSALSRA